MSQPEVQPTTRDRITDAALKLFSTKGYMGTATREIAAEAGIAEVTLFRHFASKEALFEAVLSNYSFLPTLKEIMPSVREMPFEKALTEIARRFLGTLSLRKDLIRLMHSECHLYPEKIKSLQHSFLAEMMGTLAGFFVERRKQGELKPVDEFLAARLFLGTFYQYFITKEIFGIGFMSKYDDDSVIDGYVKIISRGTKK